MTSCKWLNDVPDDLEQRAPSVSMKKTWLSVAASRILRTREVSRQGHKMTSVPSSRLSVSISHTLSEVLDLIMKKPMGKPPTPLGASLSM